MFASLTITVFRIALLVMAAFLFAPVADANDDDVLESGMRRCASVTSDDARLACFDELSDDVSQGIEIVAETDESSPADMPIPVTEPGPADEQAPVVKPLTDDVGRDSIGRDKSAEPPQYAATLTKCDRSSTGRYFFYFVNGQVWKQSNSNRLWFRECNFEVTISRDVFGFKMAITGQRNRIRISRVR